MMPENRAIPPETSQPISHPRLGPPLSVELPPGQQRVAADKWPYVGEREPASIPQVWTIEVTGRVAAPFQIRLEQLKDLPQTTLTTDIHCVTRWSKLGVSFGGVLLADLLATAQVFPSAGFVSFLAHSTRQHSTSLSLADAIALQTLVAWQVDGQPLPVDHGGPVRCIVPGRYFYKSLKWLKRIEVLDEDRLGFWESDAGYHNHADPWKEERYLAPNLDRRQAKAMLTSKALGGRDLRGLQASGLDLRQLQAQNASLRDAHFERANLQGADFSGANLSNAHFQAADLTGANFENADLEGADFTAAHVINCNLQGASLFGTSFVSEAYPSSDPRLPNQQTGGAGRLPGADLTGTQITPAQIAKLTHNQARYVETFTQR